MTGIYVFLNIQENSEKGRNRERERERDLEAESDSYEQNVGLMYASVTSRGFRP